MPALLCAALLSVASSKAAGDGGAMILRIEGRDAFFDLGREAGAAPGVRVLVFRHVSALDPRTGATVRDRFFVTEVEITEAGAVLSRARFEPEVAVSVHVGDRVELAQPPPAPVAALPGAKSLKAPQSAAAGGAVDLALEKLRPVETLNAAPPAPAEPTPEQREALALRLAFLQAHEVPLEQRANYWDGWVRDHAAWALASAVGGELEVLRAAALPAAPAPPAAHFPGPPAVSAPALAVGDDPVEVVLTYPGALPEAVLLNYRPAGTPLYHSVRFTEAGPRTLRAIVPAGAVAPPGVDWFAGSIDDGTERPIAGSGESPRSVVVQPAPGGDQPSRKDRSSAGLWIDYADWNRFKGNDWYVDVEGEFLYRVLSSLYSVRMGFGLYQGKGQSLDSALQDERAGRAYSSTAVGYHYGFTELEVHPFSLGDTEIGVIGKLLTGVDRSGFGAGFEGRLRIGHENGTNLVLASGFTQGIGNRNELTLATDRVTGWPMSASVILTNEPVMADYGVRFVYSLGRSVTDWLDLSLRLNYQLRDINHNGFGVGLAETLHW